MTERTASPAVRHRFVETNGIRMHIAEQGSGPVVVLCHGWPESWYSWRHQLQALADAGFHAVAPDQRGFGQTDKPEAIDQYTLLHLVGDIVGLLDALGEETAVIAGHDWGAPVAWNAAMMRPERFRAVIGLSVPYRSRGEGGVPPTQNMPQTDDARFYQLYFQEAGLAEAEFERDVRSTLRRVLFGGSADSPKESGLSAMVPRRGGFLSKSIDPDPLPGWLTEADIDFYTGEFERSGFRGGLNWYRNIDRNWGLTAPFAGAQVTVPALYVAGEQDLVLSFGGVRQLIDRLETSVPNLRRTLLLPQCGHWTQQERPAEVNAAMIEFLRAL
ncbi:MAG: alpha/beta fold hydrolase [Dehalococcoidia bacterium]